jgi:intein/homing endonuclease
MIGMGAYELHEAIKAAREIPVDGNITIKQLRPEIEDLFINGITKGKTIGNSLIDEYCTWETKRLSVVTGRPGCFTGDTLIHTAEGVINISEIKKGDFVLSYNHELRRNEYRIVTDTPIHKTHKEKLYKITLKDGTVIKVTGNHKFYTGSEYLQIKDILLSLHKH